MTARHEPPDDEIDFQEGVDPDTITLDPDSRPWQPDRDASADDHETADEDSSGDGPPAWLRRFSLLQLVSAIVAAAILGGGIGYFVGTADRRPNAVDVGFTRDMIDHHDQAVQMALAALAKPDINRTVRTFATEVLIFQRWELGLLDARLERWGRTRGEPERTTMTWMSMPTPLATMPGMASTEQLDALRAATGRDADQLFLTLMREHHRGGFHMAEYASTHASDSTLRDLAGRMAKYQRVEANEYTLLMRSLGFEG
jgi:uncharacterized protein (DUF305 family)